ncbi:MAG: complex I NDUFA9 subunit family protein, partial [Actinobacteria bacterium]
MKTSRVCILGGTGFVGRHLITRLTAAGICCRVPSRHPQRHRELQVSSLVKLIEADPFQPA